MLIIYLLLLVSMFFLMLKFESWIEEKFKDVGMLVYWLFWSCLMAIFIVRDEPMNFMALLYAGAFFFALGNAFYFSYKITLGHDEDK